MESVTESISKKLEDCRQPKGDICEGLPSDSALSVVKIRIRHAISR
jgi:hypothetical protein